MASLIEYIVGAISTRSEATITFHSELALQITQAVLIKSAHISYPYRAVAAILSPISHSPEHKNPFGRRKILSIPLSRRGSPFAKPLSHSLTIEEGGERVFRDPRGDEGRIHCGKTTSMNKEQF